MPRYLTESIGTFFLVLTIGLCVTGGVALAPIAIGGALMVMIFMGGHVSGGHFNPAVTLAVFMRGKLDTSDVAPYMLSQVVGAFFASLLVYVMSGQTFAPAPAENASMASVLLAEILFTFALALVVLNVATAKGTEGNSFYGLAIGSTVMVGAFSAGPISGGAFNPAVGLGPILFETIMGTGGIMNAWYYLVGPFVGGALAAVVYKMQNGSD